MPNQQLLTNNHLDIHQLSIYERFFLSKMVNFIKQLIPLLFIIFISCNTSDENKNNKQQNQPVHSKQKSRRLPSTENEITEGGIGTLLLGGDFASIGNDYQAVEALVMQSEGTNWQAKRINLSQDEWILAESHNGVDITRLHTNSTRFKTPKGIQIGQTINDLMKLGIKIGVDIDEGEMSIRLYDESISVNIDSESEKKFYASAKHNINDIPKNAKIVEFGVF